MTSTELSALRTRALEEPGLEPVIQYLAAAIQPTFDGTLILRQIKTDPDAARMKCYKCKSEQPILYQDNGWKIGKDWGEILACFFCLAIWLPYVVPQHWHDFSFYCKQCESYLASYHGGSGELRYQEANKKTLRTARRDRVLPVLHHEHSPDFKRRRDMRYIVCFYKHDDLVGFDCDNPAIDAMKRIKHYDDRYSTAALVEIGTDYLYEICDVFRSSDSTTLELYEVEQSFKYVSSYSLWLQRIEASVVKAATKIDVNDKRWDTSPLEIWKSMFSTIAWTQINVKADLTMRGRTDQERQEGAIGEWSFWMNVLVRRELDSLQLSTAEDERRCTTMRRALDFVVFVTENKDGWRQPSRHSAILSDWCRANIVDAAPARTLPENDLADFVAPLAAELQIWHKIVSVSRAIAYFLRWEFDITRQKNLSIVAVQILPLVLTLDYLKLRPQGPENGPFLDLGRVWQN